MIDYFALHLWQLWAIVAVALMALELTSGDLYLLCFGVGALITALAAAVTGSFTLQLGLWVLLSVACLFTLRPVALRYLHRDEPNRVSNADAIIGRTGSVSQAIAANGYGRVALDGDDWKAQSADGQPIAAGTSVRIVGRESIIVTVTPE